MSSKLKWIGIVIEAVLVILVIVPFLGIDGLPKTGQTWLRSGLLRATIFSPPNTGQAIDMLVDALQHHKNQPEKALTVPVSMPPLDTLRAQK